jgi:ABC-2 type transport system permease protein
MRVYLTLVRRELASYFLSSIGYVVIGMVVLLLGLSFSYMLEALNDQPLDMPVTELFYNTHYLWYILLITAPVVTMRAFALEKFSGTFETLMTTPVGETQVVLAKFTGAYAFYLVMWLPLLGCVALVQHYASGPGGFDPRTMASAFLGIALLSGLFVSLGCFASALTRNQIIAATISFTMGMVVFLTSFFALAFAQATTWQAALLRHVSIFGHMQDFVRGIVDSRAVVFHLSLTAWFLFLTVKAVESRRWK